MTLDVLKQNPFKHIHLDRLQLNPLKWGTWVCSQAWAPYLVLALAAIGYFCLNTWQYPLFDVDEPRYAETAREMLSIPGDWITPHFNYVKRFDKPVLFYWLIAGFYQLFGVSEFSARLVSAFSASGVCLMLLYVARRSFAAVTEASPVQSRWAGWLVPIIFATMLEPYFIARWSITDMTLTCWMAATSLALFAGATWSKRWYMVAGLFSGLGILTKGPVALCLPGLIYLIYMGCVYQKDGAAWRAHLLSGWFWGALLLAAALNAPWYIAVAQANPAEFVDEFVILHNLTRFSSTVSGHTGPWFYFIPVVLVGSLPWTFLLPGMVGQLVSQRKALPPLVLYSAIWFVTIFLFFSIASTKLLTYILPAFPALAILMGWSLQQWMAAGLSKGQQIGNQIALFLGIGILLAALFLTVIDQGAFLLSKLPEYIRHFYEPAPFQSLLLWLLLGCVGVAVLVFQKKPQGGLWATVVMAATGLVFYSLASLWVMPTVANMVQFDMVKAAQMANADNAVIATYEARKPSLVFYTQDKVYFVPRRNDGAEVTDALLWHELHQFHRPLYLVVKNKWVDEVVDQYSTTLKYIGRAYTLIQIHEDPTQPRTVTVDLTALPNQ